MGRSHSVTIEIANNEYASAIQTVALIQGIY